MGILSKLLLALLAQIYLACAEVLTVAEQKDLFKLLKYNSESILMDIKNNFDNYGEISGNPHFDVKNVKDSLKILQESNVDYELRTTLVAHYHTEENIKKMANELAGESTLYLQKFKDCETCIKSNLEAVPKTQAEEFQKILSKKIKNVILRGY